MIFEWMFRFIDLGTTWVGLLFLASWRVLPILALVAGLGLAFRKKISPAIHAMLWTIVVARFLLPFSFGNPLSFHGPIDAWTSAIQGEPEKRVQRQTYSDPTRSLLPPVASSENLVSKTPNSQSRTYTTRTIASGEIAVMVVLSIILLVTTGLLIRGVISHVRFAVRLRSCRVLADPRLIDLLLRECDSLGVGRRPAVREVPTLEAPAVYGLWRHTICLPVDFVITLTEQELRWVIRHELAHIRRRDIAVMALASIASACHWFNPLVWITIGRLRAAIEAAADRIAIGNLSQSDVASYGHLLLRLAKGNVSSESSPTLGLLPFASGKHLKQRVKLLLKSTQPNGKFANVLAAILVATVALMGLTDAREVDNRILPEIHLLKSDSMRTHSPQFDFDPWNARQNEGPTIIREYNIDSILNTMRLPKAIEESGKDLKSRLFIWLPIPPVVRESLRIEGTTLIAELNTRQHEVLSQTLEIWKNGEPQQVVVEARIIQSNVKTASTIDWAGRRLEAMNVRGIGPAIAARITDQELIDLIIAVQDESRSNILFAPKVTCFEGQTVTIADQVQHPFITGVDPKEDGSLQPVVSFVEEGLKFVLTPRVGDNGSVTLAFEVIASNIGKVSYANLPMRFPGGADPHLTVQVPATEQFSVGSTVKLKAGESVVVAIPRVFSLELGSEANKTTLVTLTPRAISTQEIAVLSNPPAPAD
jgi:beta-lactamase regulating signal transducer with metallopeptidase domain